MSVALAWVEHALPGRSTRERVSVARELGLSLEVANRPELDVGAVRASGVPVVTVQAYGMHDDHPLCSDPRRVAAANLHVASTLDLAVRLGARFVLAVCGYGSEPVSDEGSCTAVARCRDFFAALEPAARERGVRILLEPLSPLRCSALHGPEPIAELLAELGPHFGAALDTGHLLDGGLDPGEVFARFPGPVHEVQARGAGSTPPDGAPLAAWLARLAEPPEVVCVEHGGVLRRVALDPLVDRIRAALGR